MTAIPNPTDFVIEPKETQDTYISIKALIEREYISSATGSNRKVAKDIVRNLEPMISLEDKIKKTISGYGGWASLQPIIETRFDDWAELSAIANAWRNELAHEKRQTQPTASTIRAVRLVEHLNYCIILHIAGFSDEEILRMLDKILII